MLIAAILGAPVLRIGKYQWAITDVIDGQGETGKFVFGKLAKYSAEGHVTIVDPKRRSQVEAPAPNLLVASSPFVYLPDYSGIAFLHVWNGIQRELFTKRFCSLIQAVYDNFFVECSVEPVADYRHFVEKLKQLDRITEMTATVHPPNPLFGHLWESLKDYILHRNADEIRVSEKTKDDTSLNSNLTSLMQDTVDEASDSSEGNDLPPSIGLGNGTSPDITDAAMLMAADGYGHGKIVGEQSGNEVIIRTSDTHKSFLHSKEPNPHELARVAERLFKTISEERHMGH